MSLRNQSVAIIGLGAMGHPIATNIAKSGVSTQVWNRSTKEVAGATTLSSPQEVDAAIVLTVLPGLPDVEAVLAQGLEAALKDGDVLVVMGTVSPVAVVALGKRLVTKGIRVVDAPVSGGDVGAQNATLSIMVGASEVDFADLLPTFKKIGSTVLHLGPLGAGELAKACNQIIVGATLTALAEAVTLGRRAGLDAKVLLDILAGGLAGSKALDVKREKIESGNFAPGGLSEFQLKDLRFALEAGADNGTALPMTKEITELYEALVKNGDGKLDHSAIIKEIERRSTN
jgi:2-hydroxy-3-oxopropionate reductase